MQLLTVSMVASPRPASIRASFFFRRSLVLTLVRYTNLVVSTKANNCHRWRVALFHLVCSSISSFHLPRTFPTFAEATHGAIAGQEVVAAGNWSRRVLAGIEATCMFNAAVNPAPTQQKSEGLAARQILPMERVIQRIAASAG
jgi:hypothetical protein